MRPITTVASLGFFVLRDCSSAFLHLESSDGILLGFNPSLDHVIFTIQQSQFPAREESGKEVETGRNTEEGHEGEDNGDSLDIHDTKNTGKKDHLKQGVLVDSSLLHVLGEDSLRVSTELLEQQKESVPEFNSRKRGETHEEEDTIKDRNWKQLESIQEEHAQAQQQVAEEHGQSSFLNTDDVAIAILISKRTQVNDAWNCCGNQPRKTQQAVDAVEDTIQAKIVVVSFAVFKLL